MYRLARRASDGTHGKRLGRILGCAVVTSRHALLDDLDLAVEPGSSTLDQWNIGCQTHLVHVPPSLHVVQCIEHNIEPAEPLHIEPGLLNVGMVGLNLDLWIEPLRCLFSHKGFRLLDVLMAEEKLSVQIAQVDCIEIYDVDFTEAEEDDVLEKLAADATSANHQDTRL